MPNAIEIVALVIAIFSALFAWGRWDLANREQRLRLRPWVYVDSIKTKDSPSGYVFEIEISNVGLLPAKNVTIYALLDNGKPSDNVETHGIQSKAVIVPHQILSATYPVNGLNYNNIRANSIELYMNLKITYELNKDTFFYRSRQKFDCDNELWVILDTDSN